MLKGSVIFFTYLITLFYLKRRLSLRKHIYMAVILGSLALIGLSNVTPLAPTKCRHPASQTSRARSWATH
jgi:hypothetical protein